MWIPAQRHSWATRRVFCAEKQLNFDHTGPSGKCTPPPFLTRAYQLILPFWRVEYQTQIYWLCLVPLVAEGGGRERWAGVTRFWAGMAPGGSDRQGPTKERVTYLNRKPTRPPEQRGPNAIVCCI